jgi:hypothetical protein
LTQILAKVEELGDAYGNNGQALTGHMRQALGVFGGPVNHGYTEDHLDHVINYCRSRVEYVLHLAEREEREDAYQLARQTLRYYLRNSSLGNGGGAEL